MWAIYLPADETMALRYLTAYGAWTENSDLAALFGEKNDALRDIKKRSFRWPNNVRRAVRVGRLSDMEPAF